MQDGQNNSNNKKANLHRRTATTTNTEQSLATGPIVHQRLFRLRVSEYTFAGELAERVQDGLLREALVELLVVVEPVRGVDSNGGPGFVPLVVKASAQNPSRK